MALLFSKSGSALNRDPVKRPWELKDWIPLPVLPLNSLRDEVASASLSLDHVGGQHESRHVGV